MKHRVKLWAALLWSAAGIMNAGCSQSSTTETAASTHYAQLEKLPDMAGTWSPAPTNGPRQPGVGAEAVDKPALVPEAVAEVNHRKELSAQGRPFATNANCVPRGGSAFWSGPGGKEIAFLPSKILIWGGLDHDGNDIRRIYTDGRSHDTFVDSYMGDSIGKWEGDTLVVDTVGFWPSVSAASDIANGGGMHMVERFHLADHDTLKIDIEITAPKVLTEPYKFSRTLVRKSGTEGEAKETICVAGSSVDKVDSSGSQYLETTPPPDLVLPPGVKLN